ncbi:MAG TPA: hypothetical protein VK387_07740 [Thermoleophilaceae bacterium]|nr:hypothetical protein [Thermoleophilaceae bacterium]
MAEAGLFLGWGQVVRGREEQALERFNESMQFYARLQDQGRIESFDVALLTPHGGDLQGFILIRGSAEQIDSLRRDEEFERLQQKVDLIVDRLGIVDALVDERLAVGMGIYQDAIGELR